jgi:hypothetical protein
MSEGAKHLHTAKNIPVTGINLFINLLELSIRRTLQVPKLLEGRHFYFILRLKNTLLFSVSKSLEFHDYKLMMIINGCNFLLKLLNMFFFKLADDLYGKRDPRNCGYYL